MDDLKKSMQMKLEILRDEAASNMAIVNPFNLNTDNMTRIAPFSLFLPKRQLFKLTETKSAVEPKEKLHLSDF